MYCMGSLKLLSGNGTLARLLLAKDFVAVSLRLSQRLVQLTDPKDLPLAGHILVQVGGVRMPTTTPFTIPAALTCKQNKSGFRINHTDALMMRKCPDSLFPITEKEQAVSEPRPDVSQN